jgi:hypothetical protein
MRKLVSLATALSMLAFAVPMEASAQAAPAPAADPMATGAGSTTGKVSTVKKNKRFAQRHAKKHVAKRSHVSRTAAYKPARKHAKAKAHKKHHARTARKHRKV